MTFPRSSRLVFQSNHRFCFGDFEYSPERRELRKQGVRIRLQPQPLAILLALLDSPGNVVTREELRARLWGSDTFVEFEQGLNSAIKRLRDALCDSADNPRYIETVPGEGYRFITQVERFRAEAAPSAEAAQPPISPASPVERDAAPVSVPQEIHERTSKSRRLNWGFSALVAPTVVICIVLLTAALPSLIHSVPRNQIHSLSIIVSAAPDQDLQAEILSEAAGEAVIRNLRRADKLKVVAEHTLATPGQAFAIGRELGCDAVLVVEGERQGDRFRVRIETLNSKSGDHLWEETVTGRVTEAAWVNANVAEVVVRRFNAAGKHNEPRAVSSAAFQEYVRGRYFWNKRTASDLQQAFTAFRAAIRDDPNFALAYAGLAQTYAVADLHDPAYHAREETYQQARESAERAITLDPGLASAHVALAQILRNHDRNMAGAEREYLKALELDNSDATAHQWYAEFLSMNGRHDEAIVEIDRARELDPLSAVITAVCGTIRIQARRYAEALPFAEEALRLDPHYASIYTNVVQALEGEGRYSEALDALAKQAEVSGDAAAAAAAREDKAAYLYGGIRALDRQRLKRALMAQPSWPDQQYVAARLYCRLGEVKGCLASLEQAVSARSETVTGIKIDPSFDIIHNDPRYAALVLRFGFTSNHESDR